MFKPSAAFQHSQKVVNVVPGDFNNDGRLDLLVMSEGGRQGETDIAVYFSDLQGGFGTLISSRL